MTCPRAIFIIQLAKKVGPLLYLWNSENSNTRIIWIMGIYLFVIWMIRLITWLAHYSDTGLNSRILSYQTPFNHLKNVLFRSPLCYSTDTVTHYTKRTWVMIIWRMESTVQMLGTHIESPGFRLRNRTWMGDNIKWGSKNRPLKPMFLSGFWMAKKTRWQPRPFKNRAIWYPT